MKKKEIRWVSKDRDRYELWSKKPRWNGVNWWVTNGYLGCPCRFESYTAIKLKRGGLAKIIIERQY